jgi:hypothetical protein
MKLDSLLTGVIALGTAGIVISILNLIGNNQPEVMVGIMISGSIIFGTGLIATVIAKKK